jgi:HK97 family phage prohead protease
MRMHFSPSLEFKRQSLTEAGEFVGLASVFGNVDLGGDVVERGAFTKSLAKHAADGSKPALLWAHDMREPIGALTGIKETGAGLEVVGKLTLAVPRAAQAHALLRDGALAMSFGYSAKNYDYDRDGVRHLREVDIAEASLVAAPMNRRAQVRSVKSALAVDLLEESIRERFDVSNREARRLASAAWAAHDRKHQPQESQQVADWIRAAALKLGAK